jgi:hypothetical protein
MLSELIVQVLVSVVLCTGLSVAVNLQGLALDAGNAATSRRLVRASGRRVGVG